MKMDIVSKFSALKSNKLILNLVVYGLFSLINSGVPFFALPFLTDKLLPQEYAYVDIFNTIFMFLTPIIGLSVHTSITRNYYDKEINIASYFTNSIYFVLFFSSIIYIIYSLFQPQVDLIIGVNIPSYFFLSCIIYTVLSQIYETRLAFWRLQDNAFQYGIHRIGRTILDFSITLALLYIWHFKWEGRIIAQLFACVFFVCFSFYYFKKDKLIDYKLNIDYIKQAIQYGAPLIFHIVGMSILSQVAKLIIAQQLGVESLGVFSVAFQIAMVMSLVITSFLLAWTPFFFKSLKEDSLEKNQVLVKYIYIAAGCLLIFALIIMLASPLIYHYFVGRDYKSGLNFINLLIMGFFFNAIYRLFVNFLLFNKKTILLGLSTIICGLISIGLNYLLIPLYGLEGASLAVFLGFLLHCLVIITIVIMQFNMPWLYFIKSKKVS